MPKKRVEWSEDDIETFKGLCMIFCSKQEVCLVMRVSESQLDNLVNRYLKAEVAGARSAPRITFDDAFDFYSGNGKMSLRRKQFDLAMEGDKGMLVWLGKQYLGQADVAPRQVRTGKAEQGQKAPAITAFRSRSPVAAARTV